MEENVTVAVSKIKYETQTNVTRWLNYMVNICPFASVEIYPMA